MRRGRPTAVLAALLAWTLAAPAAAQQPPADPACDAQVASALQAAAAAGVEAGFEVVRDPQQGIRNPMSILDFSCIERMFDYRLYNVFFDPGRAMEEIMGIANREVCALARDLYRQYIGRPYRPSEIRRLRRIPGIRVDPERHNLLDDAGEELNRTIYQGG